MSPTTSHFKHYHDFGSTRHRLSIDWEIDPALYKTPVAPGWLRRVFAKHSGTRLESSVLSTSYREGRDTSYSYEYNCTNEESLFALERHDGKWDLFKDSLTRKYAIGSLSGYNTSEHLITKQSDGYTYSKQEILAAFARFDRHVSKTLQERAEKAAEATLEAAQRRARDQSFFR